MKRLLITTIFLLSIAHTLYAQTAQEWVEKAKDSLMTHNYYAAIIDCNNAIAIAPNYPGAFYERGTAKLSLGRYVGAIADFDRAIALNPKYADPYFDRGYTYYLLGNTKANYRQAIADYNKAALLLYFDAFSDHADYPEKAKAAIATAEGP